MLNTQLSLKKRRPDCCEADYYAILIKNIAYCGVCEYRNKCCLQKRLFFTYQNYNFDRGNIFCLLLKLLWCFTVFIIFMPSEPYMFHVKRISGYKKEIIIKSDMLRQRFVFNHKKLVEKRAFLKNF